MKRNLIVFAIATLGLAGNAAFAEPSLELQGSQDRAMVERPRDDLVPGGHQARQHLRRGLRARAVQPVTRQVRCRARPMPGSASVL